MHFYITPHDKLQHHAAAATLIKILNLTKAGCTIYISSFRLNHRKVEKKKQKIIRNPTNEMQPGRL